MKSGIQKQIRSFRSIRRSCICLIALAIFSGCICIPDAAAQAPTTIDYIHITTNVNNGYAITTVEEKLTNPHDTPTDDEFRFLIPDDAFISGFSIFVDGVEYKADVLLKEEADEQFEQAVSEGKTAGLLKVKKENIFSYSLSFTPHQSITIRLTYEQPIKKILGEYEYILSLRETDVAHHVPDLLVNITVTSVNKINTLETPGFKEANVKYLSPTKARVTYSATMLPDRDLRVIFTTDNTSLNGEMLFYETGGQGYLMHVFSPSQEDLGTTALSKEIIFVVDKSGSMRGTKMVQVKQVFTGIITDLPPDDYFNIIFFESDVITFRDSLMEANTQTKADAANFVNMLGAGGGTNINEALLQAVNMFEPDSKRVPIIVFLTDGEPTNGVTSPHVIRDNVKNANKADVSIFTIAFGIEDEENYDFLRALSLENYGVAEQFDLHENSETEMNTFYKTISTPVITDMDWSYTDSSDIVNTGYNTLFTGSDAIILARYQAGKNNIDSSIDAITRTGNHSFDETFSVVTKQENSFIPKLWAYTKIRRLMDRMVVVGETDTDALVSEITDLSLEYGFVTPYTSLFVEVPVFEKISTTATETDIPVMSEAVPDSATGDKTTYNSAPSHGMDQTGEAMDWDSRPIDQEVSPAEAVPDAAPTEQEPGFSAFLATTGIVAIAYLMRINRKI
ncbi:MAG: VWA domain-containing protein [Methanosarcinales archaeon]|nr:VWA domain-containing protein [Methanosarcinales archaeon]